MYGVSSSHEGTACGGTDWLHVVVVQYNAIIRKSVNVWCGDLLRSMETDIVPTLIGWIETQLTVADYKNCTFNN